MVQITNWYDFTKYMRRKRRWSPRGAMVVALRGAELVRVEPSELKEPEPEPEPVEEKAEE